MTTKLTEEQGCWTLYVCPECGVSRFPPGLGDGYDCAVEHPATSLEPVVVAVVGAECEQFSPAPFTNEDVERVAEALVRRLYGDDAFDDEGVEETDYNLARAALSALHRQSS